MAYLPRCFPYVVELPLKDLRNAVAAMGSRHRADVPNGSSFAVTSDANPGKGHLWLSKCSMDFLCSDKADLFVKLKEFMKATRKSQTDDLQGALLHRLM
jgi:hypothetical protein